MQRSLKKDTTGSQNLVSAALSLTTAFGRKFKLEQVTLKASVAITETITITLVSAHGSNYNVQLAAYDMVAERNFVFRPSGELNLQDGDEILVECTNANTTGVVYAAIKTSEVLK